MGAFLCGFFYVVIMATLFATTVLLSQVSGILAVVFGVLTAATICGIASYLVWRD